MSEDPLLLLFGNQCCGRELKTKPAYLVELERQKAEEAAAASSTDEVQQKESDKVTEGNTVKNTEVGSEGAEENPEGNEPSSGEGAGSEEGTDHEHTQQAGADSAQEMADTFEEVKGCVEEAFRYIDRDSDGHLTKNECLLVAHYMGERRKGARESWEHLLPRMDEDNSNTIELEEWVGFYQHGHESSRMSIEAIKSLMEAIKDVDFDKSIHDHSPHRHDIDELN